MDVTELNVDVDDFTITSKVFIADNIKRNPSIFITPVFGGIPVLENVIARMFAYAGFNAFVTDFMPYSNFSSQIPDLDVHDRTYEKSVRGLEALRKHISTFDYVDPDNIGLFGMSLGGIFTALNARMNQHFKASVIIAGSGDHASILANSNQVIMKEIKRRRKKFFSLSSNEEYEEMMERHNKMEPLEMSKHEDKKSVLMYISTNDKQVPSESQVKTWKSFGRPKAKFFEKSHLSMILTVPFTHFREIIQFYNERLKKAP